MTTRQPRRARQREVALAEAQAVLAIAGDDGLPRRGSRSLVAAVEEGEVPAESEARRSRSCSSSGCRPAASARSTGPGGEQAALRLYRRLPRGRELGESAREVSEALAALEGQRLESISVQAVGPGAFTLSLDGGRLELSVRLDRQGARLASVGV